MRPGGSSYLPPGLFSSPLCVGALAGRLARSVTAEPGSCAFRSLACRRGGVGSGNLKGKVARAPEHPLRGARPPIGRSLGGGGGRWP